MKTLVLVSSIFFAVAAQASNWGSVASNIVDKDTFTVWEVDQDSIVLRDGMRQAWVRYTRSPIPENTSAKYSSLISLDHFNCEFKEIATSQSTYYSGRFGSGEILHQQSVKKSEVKDNMVAVVPNSYHEAVLKAVCAFRIRK